MNRTDVVLAGLALLVGVGLLFLSNAGTTLLASMMLRSQGATAALAYLDEYECCDYYNYGGISPADVDQRYPTYNYAPIYNTAGTTVQDEPTDYYGGPLETQSYWAPIETNDPIEPTDYYGGPYGGTTIYDSGPSWSPDDSYYTVETTEYYDDTPWYYSSFPGFGQFITPILPPIVRPAPAPTPVAPQPSCSMSAQPPVVPYGGSTTVYWNSSNTSAASLSNVGGVPASGSRVYQNLASSFAVSLTVSGPGGTNYCSTTIQVQPQQQGPKPTCLISAHPSLIHRGQSADLAWMTQNATQAYLGGGQAALSGGITVTPAQTTTYTLTVYGQAGASATCAAPITVQ